MLHANYNDHHSLILAGPWQQKHLARKRVLAEYSEESTRAATLVNISPNQPQAFRHHQPRVHPHLFAATQKSPAKTDRRRGRKLGTSHRDLAPSPLEPHGKAGDRMRRLSVATPHGRRDMRRTPRKSYQAVYMHEDHGSTPPDYLSHASRQ